MNKTIVASLGHQMMLLTANGSLEFALICLATQLNLHKGAGNASSWFGKMPCSDHLRIGKKKNIKNDIILLKLHSSRTMTKQIVFCLHEDHVSPWCWWYIWCSSCPVEGHINLCASAQVAAHILCFHLDWRGRCSAECIYLKRKGEVLLYLFIGWVKNI